MHKLVLLLLSAVLAACWVGRLTELFAAFVNQLP